GLAAGATGPAAGRRAARGPGTHGVARRGRGSRREQGTWALAAAFPARSRGAVRASSLLGAVRADGQLALSGRHAGCCRNAAVEPMEGIAQPDVSVFRVPIFPLRPVPL